MDEDEDCGCDDQCTPRNCNCPCHDDTGYDPDPEDDYGR